MLRGDELHIAKSIILLTPPQIASHYSTQTRRRHALAGNVLRVPVFNPEWDCVIQPNVGPSLRGLRWVKRPNIKHFRAQRGEPKRAPSPYNSSNHYSTNLPCQHPPPLFPQPPFPPSIIPRQNHQSEKQHRPHAATRQHCDIGIVLQRPPQLENDLLEVHHGTTPVNTNWSTARPSPPPRATRA